MSTFGYFALIVLPILGGFIAWAGDVIGYRLGKRRSSLWGLRPRTTARLVGVAVGVLLPLFSVGTMLLGSAQARDAVFHIGQLRRQQAELMAQNQQLEAQRQQAALQAAKSEQQAIEFRRELFATQRALAGTQQQLSSAHKQLDQARREIRLASATAAHLRNLAASLQSLIASLQSKLKGLQEKLTQKTQEMAALKKDMAALQEELLVLESQRKAREADVAYLKESAMQLIRSPVDLERGHELIRAIIEVGDTLEETEEHLRKLLVMASQAALGRGAEPGPNGLAVRLLLPLPPGYAEEQGLPDEGAILRSFAQELQAAGKRYFVVGVRVARRMYRVEVAPVGVELWALPYVRVFLENEVIYATKIDGSLPTVEIFKQLYNLVTKILRREAKEKGLLPHPETGEYGVTNFEQLFEAMEKIASFKKPVLVKVLAAQDTFIVDPLLIKIEVEEQPNNGAACAGD